MLKMVWLIFFLLMFLGLSGARHESAEVLTLFDTSHEVSTVSVRELSEVSTSVLSAETWLRTHVLAHYPSVPITTILVGDTILCSEHHSNLSLVLPALKNIHHSLTRWGFEKDIKLSTAFSSGCFHKSSERYVRPIVEFLQSINSTYYVKEANPITRKLSSIDPFPVKPNPQPTTSDPPLHSSVGFSVPATVVKNPQTPQAQPASPSPIQTASPPFPETASPPIPETASPPAEMSFSYAPEPSPVYHQATPPPYAHEPPPCRAPAPEPKPLHMLWCVAKPTVPAETLQEAVDYACGAGGADCEEIMPSGNCYYPESVVAHASYAFNSYWQKNKRNGGTCSFGGTAMLINSDPSYQLCRFIIT